MYRISFFLLDKYLTDRTGHKEVSLPTSPIDLFTYSKVNNKTNLSALYTYINDRVSSITSQMDNRGTCREGGGVL